MDAHVLRIHAERHFAPGVNEITARREVFDRNRWLPIPR
jgi:hypothetical protein